MTNKVFPKRWLAALLALSFLFLAGLVARPERAIGGNQELALLIHTGGQEIGEMPASSFSISPWYQGLGTINPKCETTGGVCG